MSSELLSQCLGAWERGVDFPAVWRDILRVHPLIAGPAIQMADRDRSWLEVPLTTGEHLVYHPEEGYSLLGRLAIVLRSRRPGSGDANR
jgi:hypothetical protein